MKCRQNRARYKIRETSRMNRPLLVCHFGRLGTENEKRMLNRKKITKRAIAPMFALAFILIMATLYAAFTDIIVVRKTEDMAGSENAISILYVGNSQIFVGELPRQLKAIAKMYDVEIIYKDLSRHANRGGTLKELKESAITEMKSRRYDYIVLHEDALQMESIESFLGNIDILCNEARENGVTPVLYSTSGWNNNGQPDAARENISAEAYQRAADETGAVLVNAGEAGIYAYQTIPGISLYVSFDPRGPNHSSKAGGFFTACVFAATLFDLHIEEIPKDSLYKGDDAIDLAQTAWEFVNPPH